MTGMHRCMIWGGLAISYISDIRFEQLSVGDTTECRLGIISVTWCIVKLDCYVTFYGPVSSNHRNLYIMLLALVLRALKSTHSKVNGTEKEKGENTDGNVDGNCECGPVGAQRGRERLKGGLVQAGVAEGAGRKKGARWLGICKHTGQTTSGTVLINFGTYNSCNYGAN